MSTIVINHEPGEASFVVTNKPGPAIDAGVTNEPDHRYCNLSHEQMRDRARISWTTPVTDRIYQFCAANGISCHALPGPELSHDLMTHIGFMTADTLVFENALEKTIGYIKRYIKVDLMKDLLEERSITGKNGSDWNCRFRVWPTTWQSSEYSVSESGLPAPLGADMNWMAMRRCPARSTENCVSAAVALLRKRGSNSGGAGLAAPMTPPSTPAASKLASGPVSSPGSITTAQVVTKEVNSPFHVKFADMLRAGNPSSTEAQLNEYLNSSEGFEKISAIFHCTIANETMLRESSRQLAAKDGQIAHLRKINTTRHVETEAALQGCSRQLAAKDAEIASLRESNTELAQYAKECDAFSKSHNEVTKLYENLRTEYEPLYRQLSSEKGVVKGLRARVDVLEGENQQLKASLAADKTSSSAFLSTGLLPRWTGNILGRSSADLQKSPGATGLVSSGNSINLSSSTAATAAKDSTSSASPPIQMSFVPSPAPFATTSPLPASPISLDFSAISKSPGAFPSTPRVTVPKVHFVDVAPWASSKNTGNSENICGSGGSNSYYGGSGGAESEHEAAAAKEISDMDRELADLGVEV